MAGCPYCHTPIRNDAKFCHSCGANLLLPEFDRAFCPQCGARVRSRQWFCQACQAPVNDSENDAGALVEQILILKEPEPPPLVSAAKPSRKRNSWIIAVLLSSVLIIPVLVWAIMRSSSPEPPPVVSKPTTPEKPAEPAKLSNLTYPAAPQLPPEGSSPAKVAAVTEGAVLQTQVAEVLNNLREAELEKNIGNFLKAYASTYPGLDKKKEKTLAIWKKYDFLALHYDLRHVSLEDPKTLTALVSWNLETMNRANRERERSNLTYKVWFSREDGGWRIKKLAQVHNP
jgi:hypothetical protein